MDPAMPMDGELEHLLDEVARNLDTMRGIAISIACSSVRSNRLAWILIVFNGLVWSVIYWFLASGADLYHRIIVSVLAPWCLFPYFASITMLAWYDLFQALSYRVLLRQVRKRYGTYFDTFTKLLDKLDEVCSPIKEKDIYASILRELPITRIVKKTCIYSILEDYDLRHGSRLRELFFMRFNEEMCRSKQ